MLPVLGSIEEAQGFPSSIIATAVLFLCYGAILGAVAGLMNSFFLTTLLDTQDTPFSQNDLQRRLFVIVMVFVVIFLGISWFHSIVTSWYSTIIFVVSQEWLFITDTPWIGDFFFSYIPVALIAVIQSFIAFFYLAHTHQWNIKNKHASDDESVPSKIKLDTPQPRPIIHMVIWGMSGVFILTFILTNILNAKFFPNMPQVLPTEWQFVTLLSGILFAGGWGVILGIVMWRLTRSHLTTPIEYNITLSRKKIYAAVLILTLVLRVQEPIRSLLPFVTANELTGLWSDFHSRWFQVIFVTSFLWLIPTEHYLTRLHNWRRERQMIQAEMDK